MAMTESAAVKIARRAVFIFVAGSALSEGPPAGQACGVVKFAKRSFSHAFSCSSDLIVRWSKSTSGGSLGGNG
jgi:hypothetical protein